MNTLSPFIFILAFALQGQAQSSFQLAPPFMKTRSVFFQKHTDVSMEFAQQGSVIRYTLDGTEPGNTAPIYKKPVRITRSMTTLKAKTFAPGYKPSETMVITYIKDGKPILNASFPEPASRFRGRGEKTLIDNEGGISDIGNPNWLGYQQDSVDIQVKLKNNTRVSSVLMDLLQDHGSWVFLPERIAVFAADRSGKWQPVASQTNPADSVVAGSSCINRLLTFEKPVTTDALLVRLNVVRSMPESHPGKGQKSWIFIDEIKVY